METMIRKLFLGILAWCVTLAAAAGAAEGPPLAGWFVEGISLEERAAPDAPFIAIIDGQEREVSLADYKGQVLLLNLWATWCAPCVEEMPSLDRLEAKLGGEDFQVMAISTDRAGLDIVGPFYAEHGLEHLGVWLDPRGQIMHALKARGLPTSFLIDRNGKVVARAEGAAPWDSAEAIALIRWYLQ